MTYLGQEAKLYYCTESVYGTTPSSPTMYEIPAAEISEHGIDPSNILIRSIGSRLPSGQKRGLRKVDLTVRYPLPASGTIGLLQKADDLSSLSLELFYEKGASIIDYIYKGMMVDTLKVSCSPDDVIRAEVALMGQDVAIGTSKISGASYNDRTSGISWVDSFVQEGAEGGTGYNYLTTVMDWELTIKNNLKRVPVIGNGVLLKYLAARHLEMSGQLTFEFESKQEFDEVINDTSFSIKCGLGGAYAMALTYCKWGRVVAPTKFDDIVTVKAPFTARNWWVA
jgi:hypothetical protein